MSDRFEISEADLHAYVDGELSDERRTEVERIAGRNPALSETIAAYRSDMARLAHAYAPLLDRPLPPEWLARIAEQTRTQKQDYVRPLLALAATLLLALAIALGYRSVAPAGEDTIVREALAARAGQVQPHQVLAVNSAANAQAADKLVAAALRLRAKAPDLSRMGYALTAVRVYDGVPGGRAVQLLYRDTGNRSLALYLRHPSSPARFDQYKQDGLRICIWQDEVLGTVMTGEMSAAEMQRLASLAYMGIES
jgi:anti-sigma factor RsiW